MRVQLRSILPLLVLSCAASTGAQAQVGFPGGISESPRPIVEETEPLAVAPAPVVPEGAAVEMAGQAPAGPQITWIVGTGGRTGDEASVFSAFGGFSRPGPVSMEGVLSYARNVPDGLDGINVLAGSLELGLFTTRLKPRGLAFAVNGEAQWVEEIAQGYSVGAALSKTFAELFELGGRLGYSGSDPEAGSATWAWVPGLTAAVFPMENTSLRANYTFDNDLDLEDSYELVAAYTAKLGGGPPFQVRLGVNQNSDVSAGILIILAPRPPAGRAR